MVAQISAPENNSLSQLFKGDRERLNKPATPKTSSMKVVLASLLVILILVAAGKTIMQMQAAQSAVPTMQVVGAGKDIIPGTRITYSDLHYLSVSQAQASREMLEKNALVVGRTAKAFIPKGEPVLESNLFKAKQSLSRQIETHERAITLHLDDEALVDHSLTYGDKVDVLFTGTRNGKSYTTTIGQNIPVIYALPKAALKSKNITNQETNRVTLAVTPDQAEVLMQAENSGKLKLLLRSNLAQVITHSSGISEEDLLPSKAFNEEKSPTAAGNNIPAPSPEALFTPPAPPAFPLPNISTVPQELATPVQQAARWVVETFSGNKRETIEIGQPGNK